MTLPSAPDATVMRTMLQRGHAPSALFRRALLSVPSSERDAWLDVVFGIDGVPDDGPELPRGCVPYLPCGVDDVIAAVDAAGVSAADVFVDVGAGVGRAAIAAALISGCRVVAVEVQGALAARAVAIASDFPDVDCAVVTGDVAALSDGDAAVVAEGSVYFLYCPFSGARLDAFVDSVDAAASARPIHIISVDGPLPTRSWLTPVTPPPTSQRLSVVRSTPRL